MTNPTGNVVRFPSGRAIAHGRGRNVAGIASDLYRQLRRRGPLSRSPVPLCIGLPALCGVEDQTIHRLAAVAAAGSLTAECAARLALRHAREIASDRSSHLPSGRRRPGYRLRVAGNALRIDCADGRLRVAGAPAFALTRLLDLWRDDAPPVCLLIGHAGIGPVDVQIVDTADWRTSLIGRSRRIAWSSVRHLLLVGIPDGSTRERKALAAIVEQLVRSRAHLRIENRFACTAKADVASPWSSAPRIVEMLAVAFPGFQGPFDGGRS